MRRLTIGELARQAGVGVETVRYYELRGLLKKPPRRGKGFRVYPPEALQTLKLVRRAKALGFSLKEIGQLVALYAGKRDDPQKIAGILSKKLEDLDERARDIERARRILADILDVARISADGPGALERLLLETLSEGRSVGRPSTPPKSVSK